MSKRISDINATAAPPARALRELAAWFDILPDAVLVEANGVWIYANPAALSMFACRTECDLIGKPMFDIIPPKDRAAALARREKALSGGRNVGIRQRLVRADGVTIDAEISSQTIGLFRGSRNQMLVVRDITARIADETRFTVTFEQAAVGMAHIAPDGHWLRLNGALAAMLGYERRELLERTMDDLTFPEDRALDVDGMAALLAGRQETFSVEKRVVRRDGSVLWVNCTRSVAFHPDGSADYVIAVIEHIDERKRAQEALRASEERFRHLVESGSELIVVVDASGDMQYVAPTVTSLLGYTSSDVIAHSVFEFIHPDDVADNRARVQRVAATPRLRENATIRLRSIDRGWRTFEISTVNLLDDPSVGGLVINGHDSTETKRLADELAQMRRVESLGRVAAAVAHEFNNVLAGADAFATLLARKNDPSLESIARGLKAAIGRGKQITAPILQYGSPDVVSRAEINVRTWLRDLQNEIEPLLAGRNPLWVEVTGEGVLYADRRQLSQVMTNLILNARDASPPGVPIAVAARVGAGGGVLEVRDAGQGIPAGALDRIFEPLFTTKHNGTGLGLSVVQQIVLRHGGSINVTSEPGVGSTFTITLP